MADLAKVNGDLGRVAGLFKLWLAEKRDQGASSMDVKAIMRNFRMLQCEIITVMSRVVRSYITLITPHLAPTGSRKTWQKKI